MDTENYPHCNHCDIDPERVPLLHPEKCRAQNSSQFMDQFRSEKLKRTHLRWATNQYAAGVTGSMSVMVGASCVAWVAPMLARLLADDSPIKMTAAQSSWMVSLVEVGPFFTPTIAGILADKCGRKPCVNFSVLLYLISWLLVLGVYDVYALYLARALQGMGLGITFTIVPMYLGEIAETRIRGALTTGFQTMFHVGLVFEYCIGPYLSYQTVGYANAMLPLVFFATFLWQPESPHYYVMKNDDHRAYEALKALRGRHGKPEEELKEIKAGVEVDRRQSGSWRAVVSTKPARKALFLVVVVTVTKACSGFLAILSYATQAFSVTGRSFMTPDQFTIAIGVLMAVVAVLSTPFVDSLGRRPLFLISSFGCGVCNLLVGTYFYLYTHNLWNASSYGWFPFLGLSLFSIFFSFGLGPIGLTLQSELFPSNTRGIASSFCALSFTVSSFLSLKFYQVIVDNLGIHVNYWLFGVFCFLGFFITLVSLPETKGKTFAEIQVKLAGDNLDAKPGIWPTS